MKILHVGNIAGVPQAISAGLKRIGYSSDILSMHPHPFGYPVDFQFDYPSMTLPLRPLAFSKILRILKRYDLIHFHFESLVPHGFDLPIYRMLGKRIIFHHHGCELRGRGEPMLVKAYSDDIIVATPDLLAWSPTATWIPNPIVTECFDYVGVQAKKSGAEITVVHAPSDRKKKGTEHIVRAVERLKSEGKKINFICVENTPHSRAIEIYKRADIAIDQVMPMFGFYGVFSIECMAMGKPVISSINEEYREKYSIGTPIVDCNEGNVKEVLAGLIDNPDKRVELGKKGRDYVMKMHDSIIVAKRIAEVYARA